MRELLDPLRAYVDEVLGPWAKVLKVTYDVFFRPFLNPGDRLFLPYLLSALGVSLVVYYLVQRHRQPGETLRAYLFPREVWWSTSVRVDYGHLIFHRFLARFVQLGTVAVSLPVIAAATSNGLGTLFGADSSPWGSDTWTAGFSLAVSTFLLRDFGYFFGHYLLHRVPVLWEFHKAHHSATVMNPLTTYREHPIDGIVISQVQVMLVGVATGVHSYLWGTDVVALSIVFFTVFEIAYSCVANLRHSHIWLSYGPHLSYVFSSPAMHQLHHSSEERHWDRNYGIMLSVWDWMAGCIYVPKGQEEFRLGLSSRDEHKYMSVRALNLYPFVGAAKVLVRSLRSPSRALERESTVSENG